jgi:DUF4097 and DUF4098 domain-containing protein YvlB
VATWDFTATGPVTAEINLPAGTVHVTATRTEKVTVSLDAENKAGQRLLEETEVSFEGRTLRVQTPRRISIRGHASLNLRVELPAGSSVRAETASADLFLVGDLGQVTGKTASGDVEVDQVGGDADLHSASGDVRLEDASGDVRVNTASGDVVIGGADGDIIVKTASGDVRLGRAGQSATVNSASGDVRIEHLATGLADVTTVSGDITLMVARGTAVYLDVSTLTGDASSELDPGAAEEGEAALTISCRSVSGDVRITRAAA